MTRATTQDGSPTRDLTERVIGLEHGLESLARRVGDKLDDGSERFAIIKRQLEQIEERIRPRPIDRWKAAGFVVSVALVIIAWVWQAAGYPKRSDYSSLAAKVDASAESIRNRVDELRDAKAGTKTDVLLLQRRLETVERALSKLEDQRRGRR